MDKLGLNELLRYGFAGFFGLAMQYLVAGSFIGGVGNSISNVLSLPVDIMIPFAVGAFGYTLHRAIQYPLFYWATARISGRRESLMELDVERWKLQQKNGSLVSRIGEWAAQVHFLYVSALIGLLVLFGNSVLQNAYGERLHIGGWAVVSIYSVAFWHHYRYQRMEKRVFDYDRALATGGRPAS